MTSEQILAEFANEASPLFASYGALTNQETRNDTELASLINEKRFRGPIPIEDLSAYCVAEGITGAVEVIANEPTSETITLQVKGLCRTVLSLIRDDYRLTSCDLDHPGFGIACDGLIAMGIMNGGQKDTIMALGEDRRSRSEMLWGTPVTVDDVSIALNSVV